MGMTLVNHSFVELTRIGNSVSNSINCSTDSNETWYFPNETKVPSNSENGFYQSQEIGQVHLHRIAETFAPVGMYSCNTSTDAGSTLFVKSSLWCVLKLVCVFSFSLLTAVSVGFDPTSYTVLEGNTAELILVRIGDAEQNVAVTVLVNDGTAMGLYTVLYSRTSLLRTLL